MIETKIDEKGRILLPKEVREELGIKTKGKVVLVKEPGGYAIFPRKRYKNPTEALKNIGASGSKNPKKEVRRWIASRL